MVTLSDKLGVGLYTAAEAARFARVRTASLSRWIFGDKRGAPVVPAQLDEEDRIVTFYDLIQALTIRNLRQRAKSVSLQKIRDAVENARDDGIEYPLARQHRLYVFDSSIFIEIDDEIIGLSSGKDRRQILSNQIVEPFLDEIRFGDDDLPDRWEPLTLGEQARVSLDPDRRFGQPVIEPYGILVDALADTFASEGSFAAAAEAFDVPVEAVKLAVKYRDDYLTGLAA